MIKYIEVEGDVKEFKSEDYKIIGTVECSIPEVKIKESNVVKIFGLTSEVAEIPEGSIQTLNLYNAGKAKEETETSINDKQKAIVKELNKKYPNLLVIACKISPIIAKVMNGELISNTTVRIVTPKSTTKDEEDGTLYYGIYAYRSIGIGILE